MQPKLLRKLFENNIMRLLFIQAASPPHGRGHYGEMKECDEQHKFSKVGPYIKLKYIRCNIDRVTLSQAM